MEAKPITIDAQGQSMGRLASRIAILLRGKQSPAFQTREASQRTIIVKNCAKLRIGQKKLDQKVYRRTSGHPGAVKELRLRDAFQQSPRAVLLRTVRGMLPSNKQRRVLLQHLLIEN